MKRYRALLVTALIVIGLSAAAVYAQEGTTPAATPYGTGGAVNAEKGATPGTAATPESTWESIKPATHDSTWIRAHGEESKYDENSCLGCHKNRVDCIKCHQEVAPRSHTPSWARIGHGLESRWNRDKCLVCHQEDSCVDCHNNTQPSSHRSGWGGLGQAVNIHCQNCHFPVQDTGCFTCHKTVHTPTQFSSHSVR